MEYHYSKYNGIGNDFIIIDHRKQPIEPPKWKQIAKRICNRQTGLSNPDSRTGADGLLCLGSSTTCDYQMIVINTDGSEPEMCGNGIRCLAAYIRDQHISTQSELRIETKTGIIHVTFPHDELPIQTVRVNMGHPKDLHPLSITRATKTWTGTYISMGNPHFVIITESLSTLNLTKLGPQIESQFPNGVNIEFIQILSPTRVQMRVWERGVGETQACGTGACAVVVASAHQNLLNRTATVELPGGNLDIEWTATNDVWMTGPVEKEFEGVFNL